LIGRWSTDQFSKEREVRMATHVRTLGILHIAFGGMGLLAGLVVLAIFGGLAGLVGVTAHDPDAAIAIPILGGIGAFVFILLLVLSLPGIIAGFGLLQFRPWARALTIILSVFELMSVPLGTALGIYGLWVLLSTGSEPLFREPSQPMVA
jgi:hypothetical protein